MKKDLTPHEWAAEFQEFITSPGLEPPRYLTEKILSQVRSDLSPSAWKVFSKLALIHSFTAVLTLSICPQFGWRLFGDGMGLMQHFMAFGSYGCMVACGFFFLGSSLLIASLLMRPEEVRCIRKNRVLELGALTLLSLGFFVMVQAEILFGFALAWFIGSLIGGWLSLELGWTLRLKSLAVSR